MRFSPKYSRLLHLLLTAALLLVSCSRSTPQPAPATSGPARTVETVTPAGQEPYPAAGSQADASQVEDTPYPAPGAEATPALSPTPQTTTVEGEEAYPAPETAPAPTGEEPGAYPPPGGTQPPVAATPATSTATLLPGASPLPALTLTPGIDETPVITGTITATPTERPISTAMPPPTSTVTTVTIWHSWSEAEVLTLEEMLSAFQEIYPDVYFDVMYVAVDDLRGKYEAAVQAGGGPSLLFGPAEWGPYLYDRRLVEPVSEFVTDEFLNEINPAAAAQARYKGELIGLPRSIRRGVVMYRNTSIVPSAPATLDELISSARAATRGGVVGAYLERGFFFSAAHLYGLGGRLMDESGDPAFNNPRGVEWLNLLDSFSQAGPADFNGERDLELFKTGKAGIIIDGSWNRAALAQAIGAENLAIDPWPAYGRGRLSGFIQADNIYLNPVLQGGRRDMALYFMGFLLTPEVQAIQTRAGHIPVVNGVQVETEWMRQFIKAFANAVSFPILPETKAYWSPLEAAMASVFDKTASPAAALRQAHEVVSTAVAEIRARPE